MPPISRKSQFAFFAVTEIDGLGYCGGLLLLSVNGRPLEFHCTAPVKSNRAQEILYGATLREFLVCDQVGRALLEKTNANFDLLLIDDGMNSELSDLVDTPVVFVQSDQDDTELLGQRLELKNQKLQVVGARDRDSMEGMLKLFLETLPLTEPFERIYQAINEAHKKAA